MRLLGALLVAARSPAPAAALAAPVDDIDPMIGTAPPGLRLPRRGRPLRDGPELPGHDGRVRLQRLPVDRPDDPRLLARPSERPRRAEGRATCRSCRRSGRSSRATPTSTPRRSPRRASTPRPATTASRSRRRRRRVELTASTRAAMQRYTFPPTPTANVIVDVKRSVEGVHDGAFEKTGPNEITGWTRGRYPVHFVATLQRADRRARRLPPDVRHDDAAHDHDARRDLVRRRRGRAAQPRGGSADVRLRPDARGRPRRLGQAARARPDRRRHRARAPLVPHRALPRVPAPERLHRRRRALPRRRRPAARRRRADAVRELLELGHLQGAEPAARAARAAPLPGHAALAARDLPRGGQAAALGRAEHRRGAHVRRPGDPDDRRRRLPRSSVRRRADRAVRGRAGPRAPPPAGAGAARLPADAAGHDARVRRRRLRARAHRAAARRQGGRRTPRCCARSTTAASSTPRRSGSARATPTARGTSRSARPTRPASRRATRGSTRGWPRTTPPASTSAWAATPPSSTGSTTSSASRRRCRTARRSSASSTASTSTRPATSTTCRCRGCTRSPARRGRRSASSRRYGRSTARRSTGCPATTTSARCRPSTSSPRSASARSSPARRSTSSARRSSRAPSCGPTAARRSPSRPRAPARPRPYVQRGTLRGGPLYRSWFFERNLSRKHGLLRLEMGSSPNTTWAASQQSRPPSASNAKLDAFGC